MSYRYVIIIIIIIIICEYMLSLGGFGYGSMINGATSYDIILLAFWTLPVHGSRKWYDEWNIENV